MGGMSDPISYPKNVTPIPETWVTRVAPEIHVSRTAHKATREERMARFEAQSEATQQVLKQVKSPTAQWIYDHSNVPQTLAPYDINDEDMIGYIGMTLGRVYLPAVSEERYKKVADAAARDPKVGEVLDWMVSACENDRAYTISSSMNILRPQDDNFARNAVLYREQLEHFLCEGLEFSPEQADMYLEKLDARIQHGLPPREAKVVELRPDPKGRRLRALPPEATHETDLHPQSKDDERRYAEMIVLEMGAPCVMRMLHTKEIMQYLDTRGIDPNDMLAYAVLSVAVVSELPYDEENVRGLDRHCESDPKFAAFVGRLQEAFRVESEHAYHYLRKANKPEVKCRTRDWIKAEKAFGQWCRESLHLDGHEGRDFAKACRIGIDNELGRMGMGGDVGIGCER